MNSISAEYDQHYMDNFNAMIEQEKQREQARRRKKEDLYSFFELHYVPEGDYTSKIYIGCDIPAKKGKIYTFHHYQTGIEESLDALPVDFFTANNVKNYYVTANGLKKRGMRKSCLHYITLSLISTAISMVSQRKTVTMRLRNVKFICGNFLIIHWNCHLQTLSLKQGVVCSYGGQSNHYLRQS